MARRAALALAEEMTRLSRERCPSRTLREFMAPEEPRSDGGGAESGVFVPHYWAPMYHNGRGPSPKNLSERAQVIYFKDKVNDPRTDGSANYPVRLSDVRHLSKRQYREARRRGEIVVRLQVGPARGHPFFDEAAPLLLAATGDIVPPAFDDYVRSLLPTETRDILLRL